MVEMYPGLTVKLEDVEDRIFAKFDKVMSQDDLDIATIDYEIPRKVLNDKPYRRPPRFRYSPLQEALIVAYVKRLLEKNIVVMKDTPYVTNFILVQSRHNKDDIRFAVDLRALNEITQPDLYVTKTPNELMNYLGEAELFSSLDIRKAFWSMKISEEDIGYYGVFTPLGTICFLRMLFGDINAMPNFQRIYDKIILESVPKNSVAYVDDLLIFSKNDKSYHEKLIEAAMSCFQKHGIKINREKSKLMRSSVNFLGWEIFNGQRKPGNQTTDLKNRKNPTNPKETKSLLGALNFFRDAIKDYASIVRPIQEMANITKKEFRWSEDCEKAKLEIFKKLDTSLLIPRFDQEFYMYTDASMYAISGCILQKREEKLAPVKFYSKKLKYQKRQKSINLLEMQAIAYTLVANLELLYMAKITIFTDNRSVLTILRDGVDPDYTRYIAMISSFNYTIKYINTKDNGIADYLSRQEMIESSDDLRAKKEKMLESNVNVVNVSEKRLAELQVMDDELQGEIAIHPDLFIKLNDIWHKKIYVFEKKREVLVPFIPKNIRESMLDIIHDSHGHMGVKKTWKMMKLMMYWPNSKTDLKKHIKSCIICQRYSDMSPELPLLKISQLPEQPFKVIAIDVGVVSNHGLIFQTICSLTRFWVPQVIKNQSTETLIEALNKGIFLRFGRPEVVICDSCPSFVSEQFTNFLKDLNILLHVNVPYAKTQNSIVERSFRTMWDIIGKIKEEMKESRLDFETIVMTAAYYYNTHYQLTTNESPFYLVFNKDERSFMIDRNSAALFDKYPVLADKIASIKQGWRLAAEKANQVRSQDVKRKNMSRRAVSFDVNERVLIRNHVRGKLEPNFSGPYVICKKEGDTYYMRKVGVTRGKFLVRNVADLKPYNELSDISSSSIEEDNEVE
uniref:RNA-directed DNA polymerase n=1 Tax=Strongyloides venezuelensis TaxID=75913 RepID=A0A0K0FRR8_STRVS